MAPAGLARWLGGSSEDRATGNRDRLASQGLAPVLDVEVAHPTRPAAAEPRGPGLDRSNVAGESAVGHRADPGELLKLGIVVSNRSIRRYRWRSPSREGNQSWRTFLGNQLKGIWAADLFVVQTIDLQTLYVFFFISHLRRELVHFDVTANPTAGWIWRQAIEATAWGRQPRHLIHDRDKVYGADFGAKLRGVGIADIRTPYRAPLANSVAERVVRTFRQECLDHVIVMNERHLFALLTEFVHYYNHDRPHRSIQLEAPVPSPPMSRGVVVGRAILGGLHHAYARAA
jgi:transposase InsO family protein